MNKETVEMLKDRLNQIAERHGQDDFPPTWNPSPGEDVYGEVVELREVETRFGPSRVMRLRKGRDQIDVFLTPSVLAKRLESVTIGDEVGIRFLGEKLSKNGNTYQNYAVAIEHHGGGVALPSMLKRPQFEN